MALACSVRIFFAAGRSRGQAPTRPPNLGGVSRYLGNMSAGVARLQGE
jgi:hypothetical protein